MVKEPGARGGNSATAIDKPQIAATHRVLAEEAVQTLFAADDEELATDLAELAGAAEEAVEEEEEEEEEGAEAAVAAAGRGKRPRKHGGWCQAKDLFLASADKRCSYLARGLEAAGHQQLAALAARMVADARKLRGAIAAFPPGFHPPAAPRSPGRRRLRTAVGATVSLRKDVQAQYAGLYSPATLAAPCKVVARAGKWLRIQLVDGKEIPVMCSRIVVPRTLAATSTVETSTAAASASVDGPA